MNKQTLILFLILIALIIGVGIWWWLASGPEGRTARRAQPINPIDPGQAFPVSPPLPPPAAGTTSITSLAPTPVPETSDYRSNRLITLSERAVVGATMIKAATSTQSDRVLFLERETGLIVEMDLAERARRELARLPIRTPIAEAILILDSQKLSVWFSTNDGAGEKHYWSGEANLGGDNLILPEIEPEPFGGTVADLVLAPGRDRLFILERVGEETIGKTFDLKTKKSRLVFSSRANQWLADWPEKNLIALTSKPAAEAAGYLYLLNLRNDDWQKILGGVNGLATLVSPTGQKILYSRSGPRGLELGLYDRLKNENISLTVSTLPEKCVWAGDASTIYCAAPRSLPRAIYPDDWLAGEVIFDDLLWQVSAASGVGRLLWADEPGLGDAVNLLTVAGGQKFIFTDRLTNRLFLIDPVRNFVSNGVDELIPPPGAE